MERYFQVSRAAYMRVLWLLMLLQLWRRVHLVLAKKFSVSSGRRQGESELSIVNRPRSDRYKQYVVLRV